MTDSVRNLGTLYPIPFIDPTPVGSVVTSIDVTFGATGGHCGNGYGTWRVFLYPIFFPVPFFIGQPQTFGNCYDVQACVTGVPTGTIQEFTFRSGRFPDGVPNYAYRDSWLLAKNFIGHFSPDGGSAIWEYMRVQLTYMPPPQIDFDITPQTPETDRRVLIAKHDSTDDYPSRFQRRDREVEIVARVTDGVDPVADKTVYFRVIDPADPSPYLPFIERHSGNMDRDDQVSGRLSGPGVTRVNLQSDDVKATSNAEGHIRLTLTTTDRYAGDNYEIEASFEPTFTKCRPNCKKTGTITAWKRVYVEADRMFQTGAYLAQDIAACTTAPCPIPLTSVRGLRRGDRVRLIHAPRATLVGPQQFYAESLQILGIDQRHDTIEVTPYANAYFGPDQDAGGVVRAFLADAIGRISGLDARDVYTANTQLIPALFSGTFVEHVFRTDDPVPYVPYEAQVSGGGDQPGDEVRAIARRWFLNLFRNNHQHLLGGSAGYSSDLQGLTTARIGTNWSWTFVETVNNSAPARNNWEWVFNGEVTAHEMAHQWQVNSTTAGHCNHFRWNSAALYCSMHGDYGATGAPCHQTCPEFYDGQVGFHYHSAADSEYRTIRDREEPVPQH